MNKQLTIITAGLLITCKLFGQIPMDVAENTLRVGGFGEEVFYYGFSEGDQLIFNFHEVNGKELKELEISVPAGSSCMETLRIKTQGRFAASAGT